VGGPWRITTCPQVVSDVQRSPHSVKVSKMAQVVWPFRTTTWAQRLPVRHWEAKAGTDVTTNATNAMTSFMDTSFGTV
jgi:hypothetical protein